MGLLRGMARTAVVAGTATAVSNRVSRRQANRWQQPEPQYAEPQYAEPQYAQPPAAPPAGGADDSDQLTAELERLAGLKNQGVLTEEEFSAAKAKLLGI